MPPHRPAIPPPSPPAPLRIEVAMPVPLRRLFTYGVPPDLRDQVHLGSRVLAPLGRRRLTGYVVSLDAPEPDGFALKNITDVLDPRPAFGDELLGLFHWVARYYHDALGEVVRTGLPSALKAREEQTANLTDAGRIKLYAILDTDVDPATRKILHALEQSGPTSTAQLLRDTSARVTTLDEASERGWVELTYRRKASAERVRQVKVAVFVQEPTSPPVSDKERRVLDKIRQAGEAGVTALNKEFGRVAPNLTRLEHSGAIRVEERREWRDTHAVDAELGGSSAPVTLTAQQSEVVGRLIRAIDAREPTGFLLHGVTGSGKTEVYLRAIAHALSLDRGAIVLVPEIALTPQLVARFQGRFGSRIAVLHSALSAGERIDQWERIARGDKPVVVGARSAVFAPVPNLGLVVVDEEHESSFKQGERPRYHARDLALVRGKLAACPTVLGSATPSLESWQNVTIGKLERLALPERARAQAMPHVEIVDLRRTQRLGETGLLSGPLVAALHQTVERGEQAILFINRRGYSSFVLCDACGYIPECTACSITLTYSRRGEMLRCHYCNFQLKLDPQCPLCDGRLEPIGVGTERAAEDVQALLGDGVQVERMDRDTASGADMSAMLKRFRRGEAQVLVGTQMVTKGHDFPNVTLVGVLVADQSLRFPDFRASERTFQLITQVAGRAGRGDKPGRVIVQTWCPDHHSLLCAADHDFERFAKEELSLRRDQGYPPHTHLALVMITHTDEQQVARTANTLADKLRASVRRHATERRLSRIPVRVLGPVEAPIKRIKHRHRAQILLAAEDRKLLHQLLAGVDQWVDSQGLHAQIALDVDPIHLL